MDFGTCSFEGRLLLVMVGHGCFVLVARSESEFDCEFVVGNRLLGSEDSSRLLVHCCFRTKESTVAVFELNTVLGVCRFQAPMEHCFRRGQFVVVVVVMVSSSSIKRVRKELNNSTSTSLKVGDPMTKTQSPPTRRRGSTRVLLGAQHDHPSQAQYSCIQAPMHLKTLRNKIAKFMD